MRCAPLALLLCAVTVAACSDGGARDAVGPARPTGAGPGRDVPATPGDAPPPLPDESPPTLPAPTVIGPDPTASRERSAAWTVAAVSGARLLLDVSVGGPPCDVVSAVVVDERDDVVAVDVLAGRRADAECDPGVIGRIGVVRIDVQLGAPLGDRDVVAASSRR